MTIKIVIQNKLAHIHSNQITYFFIIDPKIPKVKLFGTNSTIFESQEHNLTCSASASPLPNLIWRHKGQTLKKCIRRVNCTVTIKKEKNLYPYHYNYTCEASNKLGLVSKSTTIHVWCKCIL